VIPRGHEPPRAASWLVRTLAPEPVRDEILGDLDELWQARLHQGRSSRLAYWRHVLSLLWWARRRERHVYRLPRGDASASHLLADIRFGVRLAARQPAFTLMIVATLSIGIAAATAIFTISHRVLLQPLPYPDPDRIVVLDNVGFAFTPTGMAVPRYVREVREIEAVGLYAIGGLNLGTEASPVRVTAAAVTSGFFGALGAAPSLGQPIAPAHDVGERVVVLSQDLWRGQFAADPSIVGREIRLNSAAFTVVGVMPPGFTFPARTALWIPVGADSQITGAAFAPTMIARLQRGVTSAAAEQALVDAVARAGAPPRSRRPSATELREELVGHLRPNLIFLVVLVGLLLGAACASVAGLMLSRLCIRRRELLLRAALGASGGRLLRQLVTESAAIAAVSATAGLLLAVWMIHAFAAAVPTFAPDVDLTSVRPDLFLLGTAVSLAAIVLFGLGPAVAARRTPVATILREGASPGRYARRTGQALVVAQIATSLVILAGASTTVALVLRLNRVDLGFHNGRALMFEVTLPFSRYSSASATEALLDAFETRLRQLPGVRAVGATSLTPGSPQIGVGMRLLRPNETEDATEGRPSPALLMASPDFFRAMGIRLLAGRTFTAADSARSPRVAVVSASAARTLVKDPAQAVGLRVMDRFSRSPTDIEIVGVVDDVRLRRQMDGVQRQVYLPVAQSIFRGAAGIVVDAEGDDAAIVAIVRRTLRDIDPELPIYSVLRLEDVRARYVATERITLALTGLFSAVALLLAAVGLYGVLSQLVAQRRREIGIRMALGADATRLTLGVVRTSMTFAIVGGAIGIAIVLLGARTLAALLPSFAAPDPPMLAVDAAVLLVVAALASWEPARRAARVDPLIALRAD
jgi:predicted permease